MWQLLFKECLELKLSEHPRFASVGMAALLWKEVALTRTNYLGNNGAKLKIDSKKEQCKVFQDFVDAEKAGPFYFEM